METYNDSVDNMAGAEEIYDHVQAEVNRLLGK